MSANAINNLSNIIAVIILFVCQLVIGSAMILITIHMVDNLPKLPIGQAAVWLLLFNLFFFVSRMIQHLLSKMTFKNEQD